LYYGDLDGDGTVDIVESRYDEATKKEVPERTLDVMSRSIPLLQERFPTHRAYAEAGVAEILGDKFKSARVVEANWLESTVFLNRGNHFEARPLPAEAQFAPAFGICVADFDGDGNEDIFLAQNFFGTVPDAPRYDAGRGLWLRGNGKGSFDDLPGQESGVKVYGEQRGSAVCDYDADGRVDLVVSQNGAETRLYRNVGAEVGLRMRLKAGAGNPTGVGAQVRIGDGLRWGPMRELHGGSGYWSQDGAVQVLGGMKGARRLEVRWPGGRKTMHELPSGAREVQAQPDGTLTVR